MSALLACPDCGETRLYSEEVASIGYPATFDKDGPNYTGEVATVFDEATQFQDLIYCTNCGQYDLNLTQLVPAREEASSD